MRAGCVFPLVFSVFLFACTSEPKVPSGEVPQKETGIRAETASGFVADDFAPLFVVEIPEVGVAFPYWKELASELSQSPDRLTDRIGERWYNLSGSDVLASLALVNYDRPADGIWDWSIPGRVRNSLMESVEGDACGALLASDVYVPVDLEHPYLCRVVRSNNERIPVVIAIGFGHPFEGLPFLESMAILFGKKQAVILSSIVDFPEIHAEIGHLIAAFEKEHPDAYFPSDAFKELDDRVRKELRKRIEESSQEIQNQFGLLESVGRGMDLGTFR